MRGDDGELRVASWREALEAAAAGLRAATSTGVLVGGRVSSEDAYAYGKFARIVLGTNDVDFRARPHSAEEADFLASTVVATGPDGGAVTYADLESAGTVLLVGLEPEDECPIVFLRLRKAFRKHRTAVYAVAPFATRGLAKVGGTLIPTAPGTEPEVLRALGEGSGTDVVAAAGQGLRDNAVVLVGERLATVPGALSAAVALAEATGARLAWVPRRAGERGALEAGALPTLLPGGRPLADAAARVDVGAAWGVESLRRHRGPRHGRHRRRGGLRRARRARRRRRRPARPRRSPVPPRRFDAARSCVASRSAPRRSPRVADVVLPVAAHAEKAGTFVDWEGRVRPLRGGPRHRARSATSACSTCSPTRWASSSAPARCARCAPRWRRSARGRAPVPPPRPSSPATCRASRRAPWCSPPGATCSTRVAAGRRAVPRRHRPGPGRPGVRRRPPAASVSSTATTLTVRVGDTTVTAPVLVSEMADHVVWLPTNSVGSDLRAALAGAPGALVSVTKEDQRMSALLALPQAVSTATGNTDNPIADFGDTPLWLILVKALLIFVYPACCSTLFNIWFERRVVGPHAAPHRPQRQRPVRPAADPRRRREAGAEGGHHPEGRRQAGLHPRAGHRGDPALPGVRR